MRSQHTRTGAPPPSRPRPRCYPRLGLGWVWGGCRRRRGRRQAGIADVLSDGPDFVCPLSGLRAPELAAGEWERVLEELFAKQFGVMLAELSAESLDNATEVCADYEEGKKQVYASLELKLQHWRVLPWVLAGVAHPDRATAKQVARRALALWEATSLADREQAHRLTMVFLEPGPVRDQLEHFANSDDAELWDLNELALEAGKLCLIPVVERSIEAKHSLANIKGVYRRITPPYISLFLRMPGWERGVKRRAADLTDTIAMFDRTRKSRRLAVELGIDRHPTLRPLLRDHGTRSTTLWSETAAVMYSEDAASKYATFDRASKANRKAKTQQSKARARTILGGIPRLTSPAYDHILEKAQHDHFKLVARAGRVYSIPLNYFAPGSDAHITPLRVKLGLEQPLAQESVAEMLQTPVEQHRGDDDVDMLVPAQDDFEDADMDANARRIFFSVIDCAPSRARVIPLPPGTARRLGADDLQIAIHKDHLACQGGALGRISVGSAQVSTNPVMVLSRFGLDWANDTGALQSWKVRDRVQFSFSGVPMSDVLIDLTTRLVQARACPGNDARFACQHGCEDWHGLEELEALGFVQCHQSDGAISMWSLTRRGMACLDPVRVVCDPEDAVQDRGLPIKDKSCYELLLALERAGWIWVPGKAKALVPYRTLDDKQQQGRERVGATIFSTFCLWVKLAYAWG